MGHWGWRFVAVVALTGCSLAHERGSDGDGAGGSGTAVPDAVGDPPVPDTVGDPPVPDAVGDPPDAPDSPVVYGGCSGRVDGPWRTVEARPCGPPDSDYAYCHYTLSFASDGTFVEFREGDLIMRGTYTCRGDEVDARYDGLGGQIRARIELGESRATDVLTWRERDYMRGGER